MTRQEIINAIDVWNDTTHGAGGRNTLRRAFNWHPGTSLGQQLAQALNGNHPQPINNTARPTRQVNTPPNALDVISDMVFDREPVHKAAKMLLTCGWNFTDPSGMMNKDPDEVEDFLQGCSLEIDKYSEMYPSRRNLLKMICDAYLRDLRHQQ